MGNLSPEEILKRIEGDSKGKAKGNQKNGTNGPKDHSSVVANSSRNSGARKRSDKKDRQTDKATKRSIITDSEVFELSTKMETSSTEKTKVVVVAESMVESKHRSSMMGTTASKVEVVTSSTQSDKVEEMGSGATSTARGTVDEGVDDEEQYLSADEGANSNFSDDIKTELQYHTDEQSGASGSRDFISDGANYRADDEEISALPVTAEESEFIQVTARSKRRGAAAPVQHQLTIAPGMDRKNVYCNSTMDRGARTNVRRDAGRLRRSSIQLPPDNRRNQPYSHGNTSPSPIDCEVVGGKGQITVASGSVQSQQQRHQQHLKFATSTLTNKKMKYGLPSSLQTSRTASPDRRGSQPLTLKYSVAAGNSGSSPAVTSLSENLSNAKREVPEQQIGTATAANTKTPENFSFFLKMKDIFSRLPSAQRSWADIAKRRLYGNAETRPNEAPCASLDSHSSVKEEYFVTETMISDHAESAKKPELSEQKGTVNVGAVSTDPAVKDYSFFFDPNEPIGTVLEESDPKSSSTVLKRTDEDSKSFKPRCSGIVLNLDGGRQVILPENDIIATGSPTMVDIRQRPEIITANDMWRYFMEDPIVTVTYKEYKRQKERSQQQDLVSDEQEEKQGKMAKENEKKEEGSK
uniref:Non-specific serine/threonine protein kinase n=1 Tax=Elaeophora elaphi TaxID=1147741 RepID=A0A158Q717_9BILA